MNTSPLDITQVKQWVQTNILPHISKVIERSCDNVTLEIKVPENCFFVSVVYFVNIKFQNNEALSVVIKKPAPDEETNAEMHCRELIENELIFYGKVAGNSSRFPRCFYAYEDPTDWKMSFIVTENIETMGFKMCHETSNIPLKYIIAGVREMGKLHAMGYMMKINQSENFWKIVGEIQETRYFPGEWNEDIINITSIRPVNYLRRQNYDSKFCDKMEIHLRNAFQSVMLDAVKPCEPLAVLCHGDFTRNNIFFRDDGGDLEAMLIDFAMLRYSSPAIDMSTFLYISCSAKDICENFTEIFNAYHEALIDYLQDNGVKDIGCYSYDNMLADYKRRAMFGYIIALFFSPVQRGLVAVDLNAIGTDEFMEYIQVNMEAGGDELSKEFADLLINLRENGCLCHVVS